MPTTSTKLVQIAVNGQPEQVPEGSTLADILRQLEISADRVAVEKDRAIVRKADWDSTVVQAGAQLEIVQFVGGG